MNASKPNPSWGIASTIRADPALVKRFVAHHLDMGAHWISIFFDDPQMAYPELFDHLDKVHVTVCDADYWDGVSPQTYEWINGRQGYNAKSIYKHAPVDWLAHIDVDEFIMSDKPFDVQLKALDMDILGAFLKPIEVLAPFDETGKTAGVFDFKRKSPNSHVAQKVYPDFGEFKHCGFLSYHSGKTIVRTGVKGLRQRLHKVLLHGERVANVSRLQGVDLCHFHAGSWDLFWQHLPHRITNGSYKSVFSTKANKLHELLTVLSETEGEQGVRQFFDEFQLASPDLIALLKAHDMHVSHQIDFDSAVQRYF